MERKVPKYQFLDEFVSNTEPESIACTNPLYWSIENGSIGTTKILVEDYKFDFKKAITTKGLNAFLMSSTMQNPEQMEYFINKDPSVLNSTDYSNNNALHLSASHGYFDVSKILVEKYNVSIYTQNKSGKNPFLCAASKGQLKQMEYFIKKDPEIVISKGYNGWNALHYSVASGSFQGTKYLVEKIGMKISEKNDEGHDSVAIIKKLFKIGLYPTNYVTEISNQSETRAQLFQDKTLLQSDYKRDFLYL